MSASISLENSTNGHAKTVQIDTRTGERGDYAAFVAMFAHVWEQPAARLERLLDMLSPDITLIAPTIPPRTDGRADGKKAFLRALAALPDMRAEVRNWCAMGEVLFIEVTFIATISGREKRWTGIDRFRFENGQAAERIAFFDSWPLRLAFLRNPKGWRQFSRLYFGI